MNSQHNDNPAIPSPLHSFPPVVDQRTHTLILGSMPGRVSLAAAQYYAHPRNAFWHIMGEIFGAGPEVPYGQRLGILLANRIGLWDVIGSCTRATSLDTDIDEPSIAANDFRQLLQSCRSIRIILFNGSKAEQTFARHVRPGITTMLTDIRLQRLVSTSPANARYSQTDKTAIWRTQLLQAAEAQL